MNEDFDLDYTKVRTAQHVACCWLQPGPRPSRPPSREGGGGGMLARWPHTLAVG